MLIYVIFEQSGVRFLIVWHDFEVSEFQYNQLMTSLPHCQIFELRDAQSIYVKLKPAVNNRPQCISNLCNFIY